MIFVPAAGAQPSRWNFRRREYAGHLLWFRGLYEDQEMGVVWID